MDCPEAPLWAFHRNETFRSGPLLAVNLGYDADTTGAVCGQLAGAFYGMSAIPKRSLGELAFRLMIEEYAAGVYDLSRMPASRIV